MKTRSIYQHALIAPTRRIFAPALGATLAVACSFSLSAQAADLSGRVMPYTVVKGDTVQSVSQNFLDDPRNFTEVAKASKLRDANRIYPGDKLSIPVELLRGTASPLALSKLNGTVKVDGAVAQAGMSVKEGAKLETANGATAVLTREDGTQLTMLPNSVAEIAKNRSLDKEAGWLRSSVRLMSGAMDFVVQKAGLKDHVKVNTPTSTIGVRGTEYRVGAQAKSSKVEVIQGTVAADSARASTASNTALALNGGFGTIVPESGPPLGAIALLPAPKLTNLDSGVKLERANNTLTIQPVAGAVTYSYVVSPEGQPTVRTLEGRSNQPSFTLPRLPDAKYQVALRAIDKNGLEGFDTVVPFTVAVIDKPFSLDKREQSDGVVASWKSDSGVSLYRVQVARDDKFTQIIAEGYVREPQALMRDFEPGNYFWRVGEPKNKAAKDAAAAGEWTYSDTQTMRR